MTSEISDLFSGAINYFDSNSSKEEVAAAQLERYFCKYMTAAEHNFSPLLVTESGEERSLFLLHDFCLEAIFFCHLLIELTPTQKAQFYHRYAKSLNIDALLHSSSDWEMTACENAAQKINQGLVPIESVGAYIKVLLALAYSSSSIHSDVETLLANATNPGYGIIEKRMIFNVVSRLHGSNAACAIIKEIYDDCYNDVALIKVLSDLPFVAGFDVSQMKNSLRHLAYAENGANGAISDATLRLFILKLMTRTAKKSHTTQENLIMRLFFDAYIPLLSDKDSGNEEEERALSLFLHNSALDLFSFLTVAKELTHNDFVCEKIVSELATAILFRVTSKKPIACDILLTSFSLLQKLFLKPGVSPPQYKEGVYYLFIAPFLLDNIDSVFDRGDSALQQLPRSCKIYSEYMGLVDALGKLCHLPMKRILPFIRRNWQNALFRASEKIGEIHNRAVFRYFYPLNKKKEASFVHYLALKQLPFVQARHYLHSFQESLKREQRELGRDIN